MLFTITLLTLWASLSVFFKVGAICFGSCCPLLRLQNFCGYRVNIPALCESRDPRSCIGQLCDDAQLTTTHVHRHYAHFLRFSGTLCVTALASVLFHESPDNVLLDEAKVDCHQRARGLNCIYCVSAPVCIGHNLCLSCSICDCDLCMGLNFGHPCQ